MNQIPENFYRTSIKGLIFNKNNKFLLIKEKNGMRELPGGGLNFGETPEECIRREIKEEMGLEVLKVKKTPSYFTTTRHIKGHWIANVIYEVQVKNFNITPSDECTNINFFSLEEVEKLNIFENVKAFIKVYDQKSYE